MPTQKSSSKKRTKCRYCKSIFVSYASQKRQYCSRECISKERSVSINCETCKEEILTTAGVLRQRKSMKFCSTKCMGVGLSKGKNKKIKCDECGKIFTRLKIRLKSKKRNFCSVTCTRLHFKVNPPHKASGYWYENGYKILYLGGGKGIKEHIKIMEDSIGRKLNSNEVVHHINGSRADNRINNLQLMTKGEHSSHHRRKEIKEGRLLFGRRGGKSVTILK